MKEIYLFSRDERTFRNFRKVWVQAFTRKGLDVAIINRRSSRSAYFTSLFVSVIFSKTKAIFGTSEILLAGIFSRKFDIWVFTGLGRLLDGSRPKTKCAILFMLKRFYTGQRIVVLNWDDLVFMQRLFEGGEIHLIHGEGYAFEKNNGFIRKSNSTIKLAFVGRILYSKGVDILLESFLACRNKSLTLSLYGDMDFGNSDSLEQTFLDECIDRSHGRIKHYGYVNNVSERLKGEYIVVSMSQREGLPYSVLDAVDAGCSLLLSDVPGNREFAGLKGCRILPRNTESLTEFLRDNERLLGLRLSDSDKVKRVNGCALVYGEEAVLNQIMGLI